ncbi:CAP domain-containing protein [Pseudonocardia sp. H11422]|uniref:CAP domain-containing protein n=1 Tax=Pseudonocardia sp. H11422 TaxID=2835866 RepID=UPI003977A39F
MDPQAHQLCTGTPGALPAARKHPRRGHDRLHQPTAVLPRPSAHGTCAQQLPREPSHRVGEHLPEHAQGPNGKLVWDDGEPMDQAGDHSSRSEIVATGFPTVQEALEFWMQNDEKYGWEHRNHVLDCTTQDAGAAHLHGGSGNHYWTVDLGNR